MRIIQIAIAYLILSLINNHGQAQHPVFFKAFDYQDQNNGAIEMIEVDSDLFISGVVYGWLDALQYVKVDGANGDTIWQTVKSISSADQDGQDLIMVGDTVFIIGEFYDSLEGARDMFFMKLNVTTGVIDTFIPIDVGFNDGGDNIAELNGDFYISGTVYDSAGMNDNLTFTKINRQGGVYWSKTLDFAQYEYPESMAMDSSGNFIIGGDWYNPSSQSWDFFLLKLDSAGSVKWHKSYGNHQDERFGYAITTEDGGYAIAGYRERNGQPDGLLIKTDSGGTFQWEKLYGKPQQIDLFKILRQDSNGNYILAGNSRDPNAPNTPRAWLMKTNLDGDTLWSRLYSYYGGDSHTYVEDMITTSDGGYALSGYTIANVPTGNDLWVLKTDSLGRTCANPPCEDVITGKEIVTEPSGPSIRAVPNPSKGPVTFHFPESAPTGAVLQMVNSKGQRVQSLSVPAGAATFQCNLDLPAGLYLVQLVDEGKVRHAAKLIISG